MSSLMKKGLLVLVALVLLIPALSGCSKPAAQVTPEDSIVRTTEDWPTYIDPAVGSDFSDSIALLNLYDSLVFPMPDGTVSPHLATDWTISPDGLTYTFTIRDGVKFHNGDILTADDVAFSMQRLLTIGEGFAYLFTSAVKDVTAPDAHTVQMTLNQPFGPFIQALVRLYVVDKNEVMAHIEDTGQYGDLGDYGKGWLLTNDAGCGPYTVQDVNMESYVLAKKFDDYWGGWDADAPNYFKEMATSEPTTERTMVANRELEITDELQPLENYDAMAQMDGVDVATFFNGHNLNIMLNTKKAPTDDVHFRKALAYCLDYATITTQIYPGSEPCKGPVPFNLPGHDDSIQPYTQDLDKARAELAQSKYANELDQYPVEMSWCAEAPEEEKIALLFQANAADIGITVNITKKPFGSMEADAQSCDTTPNASIVFVAPDYADAGSMLMTRYDSSSCGTWQQMEWLQDSEIDSMIEDALATTDTDARYAKYAEIQEKIVDLCPTLWLFDQAEKRAYQSAYIDWPAADRASQGVVSCPVMGYDEYAHDMKVYPDKRAELLGN